MTPSTVLAVDGSMRTFTCVDVIPSAITIVGCGESGIGVLKRTVAGEVGRMDVPVNGMVVGIIPPCVLGSQPALRSVNARKTATNRMDTLGF